jgi:hypothetical protein
MKNGLHGQHFPDDGIITAVRKCVTSTDAGYYEHSMQATVHRWQKCIASGDQYVE